MKKSAISANNMSNISPFGWLNTNCHRQFEGVLADFGSNFDAESFCRTYIIEPLAKCVWPRWDYPSHAWHNDIARNSALALTKADLDIMLTLQGLPSGNDQMFNKARPLSTSALQSKTHYDLFDLEDNDARLKIILSYYQPYLPTLNLGAVRSTDDIETYIFRTKGLFQRARPATLGLVLNKKIRVYPAKTALHPSLVSGHATQAMFIATELYLQQQLQKSPAQWQDALKYFAVDMGDRRVFAGVHYPSDNLASWFMLATLAKYIWPDHYNAALRFMNVAIERSVVYQATLQSKPHDCLRKLLQTSLIPSS